MAKRILIIEDDLDHQGLYTSVLTEAGYTVDAASDGVEGERKIREGKADLVLLDIILPKTDGMNILKNLKAFPPKTMPKIVLLTNLPDERVAKEGLKNGADGFLMKSKIEPQDLALEVRSYLK